MRLSISCNRCRQSKVKCVHEGHPPCRRCQRLSHGPSCLLTDPRQPSSRASTINSPTRKRLARSRSGHSHSSGASASVPSHPPRSPPSSDPLLSSSPVAPIPPATLIAACDIYRKKFPIVNFLHYPSLISDLSRDATAVEPVFLAALLSLCARFMSDPALASSETYAEYARTQLAQRAFEAPSLPLAQSLVMISLYEWGSGRPYRAWMYSGMATYMIQSLLKSADDTMELDPAPETLHADAQIGYEQLVRTYWCCFAQDCELGSGARQHFALSFRQISVPLPISDADFAFGRACPRLTPGDWNNHTTNHRKNTNHHSHDSHDNTPGIQLCIDRGLTILTRGFDIFVRILRFANESRRGRARGSYSSSRPAWHALKVELDEWRALQDTTVRYPETSAPVHVAMGYGESFAYINLVYFMSILFLYRDRFLSNPRGDIPEQGAETDESIDNLFLTAQHIGAILSALENCATPVITPYAGFSVFVAAHINMYATVYPARYPGGLERAEREKRMNFEYLERLCGFWNVGNSWWRTLQEANKFYETVRSTYQTHVADRPHHLALGGTLDEYGDIRVSRPDRDRSTPQAPRGTPTTVYGNVQARSPAGGDLPEQSDFHDLEAEMLQWPFIDESWSVGFDRGVEGAWPGLG